MRKLPHTTGFATHKTHAHQNSFVNSDARPLLPPPGAPPPAVRPLADLLSDYVTLKEAAAARATLGCEHPALRELLRAIDGAAAVGAEAELRALRRAGDERRPSSSSTKK